MGRFKKSDTFLTKRNKIMNNSGRRVYMIKDPESEIVVSLNSKLGTGEGTILGGRMTSAKAWILDKNCMCL